MTITLKTATSNEMSVTLEQNKSGFYTVTVSEKCFADFEYYRIINRMVYGNEKAAIRRFNAMKCKHITCKR